MSPRRILLAGIAFLVPFLVYVLGPISNASDSRQSLRALTSFQQQRNLDLNEFYPGGKVAATDRYQFICVGVDGPYWMIQREGDCGGRLYSLYPAVTFAVELPFFAAMDSARQLANRIVPSSPTIVVPFLQAFLQGDYVGSSSVFEIVIASLITASASLLMFLASLRYTSELRALLVALIFAFGTSAWSVGSRALWTHTTGLLLISSALACGAWFGNRKWGQSVVLMLCVVAAFNRPAMLLVTAAVAGWILWQAKAWVPRNFWIMIPSVLLVGALLYYHRHVYLDILPPYYRLASRLNFKTFGIAASGHLFSPSRGLFIYSPILLASIAGAWIAIRNKWNRDLVLSLVGGCCGHWLLLSLYTEWWGGHSYGPRYMADLLPLLCLLLIPVLERVKPNSLIGGLLLIAGLWGGIIHGQAAFRPAVHAWNNQPFNVDFRPDRAWNFRDPQWARGWWK